MNEEINISQEKLKDINRIIRNRKSKYSMATEKVQNVKQ